MKKLPTIDNDVKNSIETSNRFQPDFLKSPKKSDLVI